MNPSDAPTSSTNQRQYDAVYPTPRFRSPHPYPYRHARLAASRCLRENDGNRQLLSDIQDLALPTDFGCQPPVGSALWRGKAAVAKQSSAPPTPAVVVTLGRKLLASEYLVDFESPAIPSQFRRLSQSLLPKRGPNTSVHPVDAVKEGGVL